MKKMFAILLSASVLASAPFAAQAQERHHGATIQKKVVVTRTHWAKGHRMTPAERRHMAEVRDYRRYRLSAPPRGYHWVKVNNDFLLIGVATGVISSVIASR